MSAICKSPDSRWPFVFSMAAWYCLIVPFLAPAVAFLIFAASNRLDIPLITTLCCAASSFVLGVFSFFGLQSYGKKGILWKPLIGIVASLILGFFAFVYLDALKYWHG
jgi:hypothetical protein